MAGGELSLDMLDLNYDDYGHFYEAPLHVKALGGCFVIDDLAASWSAPPTCSTAGSCPLENRIDYLAPYGKSFSIPFEELVIVSTNLEPEDLMDAAFLRRLPYKIEIGSPEPLRSSSKSSRRSAQSRELNSPTKSLTESSTRSLSKRISTLPPFSPASLSTK